ncbi:flavodoxin [Clostridium bovifaecis]|uniref:Flavodoxin n=1 Tax=Clostridium bovifaecis TaxID=2184719 RepID=A0A6I6EJ99_9CLOT|nr:flavodoxin [Clostridium bovifaecis]
MPNQLKKILVIYKSKYGSTRQYAEWIANDLKADLVDVSTIKVKDLLRYDVIIFGGFLHAVGISGLKIITDNFKEIMDKKIIVFAVGCSPKREDAISHVSSNNFTEEMKEKISFFYLRGAFNYEKLDLLDKMMMKALRVKLEKKNKEDLDEDSKGLLACYDSPVNWTNRNAIIPIVQRAR